MIWISYLGQLFMKKNSITTQVFLSHLSTFKFLFPCCLPQFIDWNMGTAIQRGTLRCSNTTRKQVDWCRIKQKLHYLLGHSVPVLVALTHIHALLVEESAFLRNQQDVTHKLTHWKTQRPQLKLIQLPTANKASIRTPQQCTCVP